MNKDIAIIGMAGRFPGADSLDALAEMLHRGRDSIGTISADRIESTTLPPDRDYVTGGYLEGIDKFDHERFGIPAGEAQALGPNLRLMLETVYETFEDAGWGPDHFSGSRTAVFAAQTESFYFQHADVFFPTLISGNSPDFFAARIAREFDLRGNVQMIDTACSSGLVALNAACAELLLGDAEQALVIGANIHILPFKDRTKEVLDVWSPDGKSRAFSAKANGMSSGEMVTSFLIKPLATAVADGDVIHAVIKATAVNNNGHRANSPTAPDSASHGDVVRLAWGKAGIAGDQVGFIEAHGSGTTLGDSLEAEGLNAAFRQDTDEVAICPISTVKSNLGHGKSAAGLAGLAKAVLSLRNQVVYPAIHVEELNPLIAWDQSAIFINDQPLPWPRVTGEPRFAGVHSFGMSGINAHVVISDPPESPEMQGDSAKPVLLTLASHFPEGLMTLASRLHDHLAAHPELRPADVARTLAHRSHGSYRCSLVASDTADWQRALADWARQPAAAVHNFDKVIWLAENGTAPDDDDWSRFLKNEPMAAQRWTECAAATDLDRPGARLLAVQWTMAGVLAHYGLRTRHVLGLGVGRLLSDLLEGTTDLNAALAQAADMDLTPPASLDERVAKLLDRERQAGRVVFIALTPGGAVAGALKDQLATDGQLRCLTWPTATDQPILELLSAYYRAGGDLDWSAFRGAQTGRLISLPTSPFQKIRHWLRNSPKADLGQTMTSTSTESSELTHALRDGLTALEETVAGIWRDVLELAEPISRDDDFFELGGDSLQATKVIREANRQFTLKLNFEDLFDFSTVSALAGHIETVWPIEQRVANIWKEVLRVEQVNREDDFFEMGGHSLLANQVLYGIAQLIGVKLNFEDFFKNPTLGALADLVEAKLSGPKETLPGIHIPVAPEADAYPAAPSQKRLWLLDQLGNANIAFNLPIFDEFKGELDRTALERAMNDLVMRHESFRTVFIERDGQPYQRIQSGKDSAFRLQFENLQDEADPRQACMDRIGRWTVEPMDLANGPLLKAWLLALAPDRHIFFILVHHIVSDAWSMHVFFRELLSLYQAYRTGEALQLPPLRIQFKDYAVWLHDQLQSGAFAEEEAYWLSRLEAPRPVLDLPTDRSRPAVQNFEGRVQFFQIDVGTTAQIKQFCRDHALTPFMFTVALTKLLFYRYTGQTDMIFGTTLAGREHADLYNLTGFFANTLVLRTQFAAEENFREMASRVRKVVIGAHEHPNYPFDQLIAKLNPQRNLSRQPLFDVLILMQNTDFNLESDQPAAGMDHTSVADTDMTAQDTIAKFDLTVEFFERDDRLVCRLEYNRHLFSDSRMTRLADHWQQLAASVLAEPARPISQIPFLTAAETARLDEIRQGPPLPPLKNFDLVDSFYASAQARPDATAVLADEGSWKRETLARSADAVAAELLARGIGYEDLVAIALPRGPLMMAWLLGILRAGAAYLSVDPAFPRERVRATIRDARPVLTVGGPPDMWPGDSPAAFVDADAARSIAFSGHGPLADPPPRLPYQTAYVIYTSGSTGRPKGVRISRHALNALLVAFRDSLQFEERDGLMAVTTLSFDIAGLELYLPLITGARLGLADHQWVGDGPRLLQRFKDWNMTAMQATPVTWRLLVDAGWQAGQPPNLALCGGEALPHQLARDLQARATKAFNVYGPTETTIWSSSFPLEQASGHTAVTSIGRPLAGEQIYVVDGNLQSLPMGVPGRLMIGGAGLARGYENRPGLTAAKFIPNPFAVEPGCRLYDTGDMACIGESGDLIFLGRGDKQVKIRGFRLELGEVEYRLSQHPALSQVAVAAKPLPGHHGVLRLVAYMTLKAHEEKPEFESLTHFLNQTLPDYMIPSLYMFLEEFPLTPNGKVDRNALPDAQAGARIQGAAAKPESDLERNVAAMWATVLALKDPEAIGRHDNFFEIGGDSFLIAQVLTRLNQMLAEPLTLVQMFQYPTIAALSQYLQDRDGSDEAAGQDSEERVALRQDRLASRRNMGARRRKIATSGCGPEVGIGNE